MPTFAAGVAEQLSRGHVDRSGLDGDQPEAELLAAGGRPHATSISFDVTGRVEDGLCLRRVCVVLLGEGDVEVPLPETDGKDHASRSTMAGERDVDELLARDAVAERPADCQVLEERDSRRTWGCPRR